MCDCIKCGFCFVLLVYCTVFVSAFFAGLYVHTCHLTLSSLCALVLLVNKVGDVMH